MRIKLILLLVFFLSFLIIVKLFQIQIIGNEKYEALAEKQHYDSQTLPAKRGDIRSSDGYSLATTELKFLLYAEPKKILKNNEFADAILPYLYPKLYEPDPFNRDFKQVLNEKNKLLDLLNSDLSWIPLKHGLAKKEMLEILKLNIEGIGFEDEPERYYPEGDLASHILGFLGGSDFGGVTGYYGVEGFYEGELKGFPGKVIEEKEASGKPILVGDYLKIPPKDGKDLDITVNRSIQYLIEKKIAEGVKKFEAKSGSVVIMDPKTGAVLSLANYPNFNPSSVDEIEFESTELDKKSSSSDSSEEIFEFPEEDEKYSQERRNLAISATFEPGSVIKGLTMSTAIDLGIVEPQTTFDDFGPRKYSGHYVQNWNRKHHGIQTMIEVLQKSNNNGAAWVGTKIGAQRLRDYFIKFGLGELTGIDLQGEDTGIIRNADEWQDIDLATASFGQGISVTPLQLVSAFSAIANEGVLMKPYVVSKISDEERQISIKPQKVRRVISKETAEIMVEMLTSAVEGGESKFYNIKDYKVAGKTGTAQIPIGGAYDPNKTNATFVGFLPSTKSFVMLVKLEEPTTSVYAAETAVPLWMDIVSELTTLLGIPPDK